LDQDGTLNRSFSLKLFNATGKTTEKL